MRILLALLLCLVLTGCGVEEPDDIVDDGWEEYQQTQEEDDAGTASGYPLSFTLAYHKDHTLDPITCGEGIQQDVASLLYEPMFQLDEQFEPFGVLCEGITANENATVHTLTIRSGVLFSDGSELEAEDVALALKRAMASERYGYRFRKVLSVKHSNRDATVTVTLASPNSAFASLLDIPVVKGGTEDRMVPVGTGPYLYVTAEDGPVLVANGEWWQQKALPVDRIALVHAKDLDTAVHLFSSDRVELLTLDPTDGHISANGRVAKTERYTTQMHYIGFNTVSGVFADGAVRAAFSAGLQRDVLVNAFLSDHAVAAWFPISPLSPCYPSELEKTYRSEETLAALAAAGQNTGEKRELILLVNEENSFRVDNAGYIAEQMSLLDWTITVRALPWTEYLVALQQGDFDLYYGEVRLCADWDFYDLVGTGGTLNYGGFSDLWMDTLLHVFSAAPDRAVVAQRLCEHFAETMPIAPICFQNYTVLTHMEVVEGMTCLPDRTFSALENWTIHLAE